MPRLSRFSCAVAILLTSLANAAEPTPTPTPEPTPVPNEVDLSKFRGRYRGSSTVSLDSGALYIGTSKTRISVRSKTSLKVVIAASIKAGGRSIFVGNTFRFTPDGILRGNHLAPGVLDEARIDGLYTATTRSITFSGAYQIRKLQGRFTGSITNGKHGRFTLRYAIFPGESAVAAYVYEYRGTTAAPHP